MDYPEIDRYASLDSPVHRFDPRTKIATFTLLVFSFVFIQEITIALFALFFSILLLLVSKLPIRFILKRVQVVLIFVLPLLIIMPLTVKGTELFSVFGISATREGLWYASLIVIRSMAAVILILTMLGSMRFDTTIKALYTLKVPKTLVQMLMFTYRYIFVIIDEFLSMWQAMSAKGFNPRTNMYGLSVMGNMVGMLIVKSYERGERVYQAMISRGYTGSPKTRTAFAMRRTDYVLSTIFVGVAILVHINTVMM